MTKQQCHAANCYIPQFQHPIIRITKAFDFMGSFPQTELSFFYTLLTVLFRKAIIADLLLEKHIS